VESNRHEKNREPFFFPLDARIFFKKIQDLKWFGGIIICKKVKHQGKHKKTFMQKSRLKLRELV